MTPTNALRLAQEALQYQPRCGYHCTDDFCGCGAREAEQRRRVALTAVRAALPVSTPNPLTVECVTCGHEGISHMDGSTGLFGECWHMPGREYTRCSCRAFAPAPAAASAPTAPAPDLDALSLTVAKARKIASRLRMKGELAVAEILVTLADAVDKFRADAADLDVAVRTRADAILDGYLERISKLERDRKALTEEAARLRAAPAPVAPAAEGEARRERDASGYDLSDLATHLGLPPDADLDDIIEEVKEWEERLLAAEKGALDRASSPPACEAPKGGADLAGVRGLVEAVRAFINAHDCNTMYSGKKTIYRRKSIYVPNEDGSGFNTTDEGLEIAEMEAVGNLRAALAAVEEVGCG